MSEKKKITIRDIYDKVSANERITMLALYDYPFAYLAQQAGIDSIIVGDSAAMVVYGYEDTLEMTMDIMIAHTQAVRRAAPYVYLVGDMPYMSYQISTAHAIKNAARFIAQAKADAVKLEGASNVIKQIKALIKASIPVVGHLGLLPQSSALQGGFKVQAREAQSAKKLLDEALLLQDTGVVMLVLECVPPEVSEQIVKRIHIPVIGIGSGSACHGQVQLLHDILALYPRFKPKFVKQYAQLSEPIIHAIKSYINEVKSGDYPTTEHCYPMKTGQKEEFLKLLSEKNI